MQIKNVANLRMLVLAVIVGMATSVGVYLFRLAISFTQEQVSVAFGMNALGGLLARVGLPAGVGTMLVLGAVGFIVGWMMDRTVGNETFSGVSSILVAGWLVGGKLPYTRMPVKVLAAALSMGAGASVGRVDPSVQIGANIGSFFGQWLHLSDEDNRLLMAAGAASAIAAAFNAPIAGVFFAMEVILIGQLSLHSSGVVMLAAVMAAAVTQGFQGDTRVFGDLTYTLGSPFQLPFHFLLGVLLAPLSWAVIRYLFWQRDWIAAHIRLSPPVLTGLTGLFIGAIGLFFPQVLGPGEVFMRELINDGGSTMSVGFLLMLSVVKLGATGISRGGGFVGGVFAPVLFIGITVGTAFGKLLLIIPGVEASFMGDPQSFAIAGMAGMLAGVVQAPITAILLVFELTNDYRMILPIMLTSITAMFGAHYLKANGIYATTLIREGINLEGERDIDVMQGVDVQEAMAVPPYTIQHTATLTELRDALRGYRVRSLCVVNEAGRLCGIVTLGDLQRYFDSDREHPVEVGAHPVSDVMSEEVVTTYPDDKLWQAIQVMGINNIGHLPVVDRLSGDLVGVISRRAIIDTYNEAIKRKLDEQHHAEHVRLSAMTGASVVEFHVEPQMAIAGHRVRDMRFDDHFVIASIQRGRKLIVPRGYTEIRAGDILTLVADHHVIDALRKIFIEGPIATYDDDTPPP